MDREKKIRIFWYSYSLYLNDYYQLGVHLCQDILQACTNGVSSWFQIFKFSLSLSPSYVVASNVFQCLLSIYFMFLMPLFYLLPHLSLFQHQLFINFKSKCQNPTLLFSCDHSKFLYGRHQILYHYSVKFNNTNYFLWFIAFWSLPMMNKLYYDIMTKV